MLTSKLLQGSGQSFRNGSGQSFRNRQVVESSDARRANWHRHLAEAWFRLGQLELTRVHGQKALTYLGRPVPNGLGWTAWSLLGQAVQRVAQGYAPRLFQAKDEADRRQRIWATRVLNRLTELHIYGQDAAGCLDSGLRELNVSEPAGPSPEFAKALVVMGVALGAAPPLRGLGRRWAARATDVAASNPGMGAALSYVLSRAAIVDLYDARWASSEEKLQRAVAIAQEHGDNRLWEEALAIRGITRFFHGRFAEAGRDIADMGRSAHRANNVQIQAWERLGTAGVLLRTGDPAGALARLAEISTWMATRASPAELLWCRGMEAIALYRTGDAAGAEARADSQLPALRQRPVAYWVQHSLAGIAETYLRLWADAREPARQRELREKSELACLAMRRFGDAFSFARPQALLWDGLLHWRRGNTTRATATWRQCGETATKLGMSWEVGQVADEIARQVE